MEEMELIHKVENGELDMLGYVMLNPELKEPFSDYARGNGITCPTAADAVRFLKEYEERLYQELDGYRWCSHKQCFIGKQQHQERNRKRSFNG